MIVKTSAVNLEYQNLYCLSFKRFFFLIREFDGTKKVGRLILQQDECIYVFLKTGHTADTFHRLGKHFCSWQRLNNLTKINDSSRQLFFRTTTRILSGLVAFFQVKDFDQSGYSSYYDKDITTFMLHEELGLL